jgi:hypothetical protein
MATWPQISVHLEPFEAELFVWEQPHRVVYGSSEFVRWYSDDLPQIPSRVGADADPIDQVSGLLHSFVAGDPLDSPRQFRMLTPNNDHVWELKTIDIRIFGWFVRRDMFIAVCGEEKELLEDHGLYPYLCDAVTRFRTLHGVEAANIVRGKEYRDVLSDRQ